MLRRLLLPCLALLSATACSPSRTAPPPTYARDIAPLLTANCTPCHRDGNIAPFSLTSYDDVRTHAGQILPAIEAGEMPPWLPDPGVGRFRNARRLTATQIALFRDWAAGGFERGVAEDPAPDRTGQDERGALGTPDILVTLSSPYTLPAGDGDVFRNFVVPVPLDRTVFVRGVEFLPDRPSAIHHVVIGVDPGGESRRLDAADPEPGYEGMFSDEFHSPDGHFVGWTPGRTAALEPEGMSWQLEPGTDLVVQMHMLPGAEPVALQPKIAIHLSRTPPSVVPFMVKLTSTSIDIPAGAPDYAVEDSYTIPVDVEAISVYPHAHYLAREITATATLPSGQVQGLLTIRDWDFHWQEFYRYESPVPLPAGTRVTMRIVYDNSAGHQHQAGQAPRRVRYGPRSSDEMADLWIQVVPTRASDLAVLARDFVRRRAESRALAAERAVADAPTDPAAHDLLGTRYLAAGRLDDAMRAFGEALRLVPGHPEASNNLGVALLQAGRPAEAVPHLRRAARARGTDARVFFNLGNALRDSGQVAAAAAAFERALAINPDAPDVLNNLAVLDGSRGAFGRAIERLQRALQVREDYPDAHHNLALALAATGRIPEAIVHVDRALTLRPDFVQARQTREELLRSR
ncbi:MAG: tetratricopeptide repeat protein [Vicinamibacterales bacterium]